MILDSKLILLTIWTNGGAGGGTSVTNQKEEIQTLIDELDEEASQISGHQIQEFDLSPYTIYADIPLESIPIATPSNPELILSDYPYLDEPVSAE